MSTQIAEALSLASKIIPSLTAKPTPPTPPRRFIAQDVETSYPPNPSQPRGYKSRDTVLVPVAAEDTPAQLAAKLTDGVQAALDSALERGGTARLVAEPYEHKA